MKVLYVCIALFLGSSISAMTQTIDKHIHESFKVEPGMRLLLKHGDGDVTISPWEKNEIDIEIVYQARFSGVGNIEPDDFSVDFRRRDNEIRIEGREPNVRMGFGSYRVKEYSYTIKAPVYLALHIDGVDGDVRIDDWQQTLDLKTVDGDIQVHGVLADEVKVKSVDGTLELIGIEAELHAKTVDGRLSIDNSNMLRCYAKSVDGSISVANSRGEFLLDTVDGDVDLDDVEATRLESQSSDGSFRADLLKTDDFDGFIRTGDGHVRIRLQRGFSVRLDVRTGDGNIRTNLSELEDVDEDKDRLRGSIHGGAGRLVVQTGDGNINLSER